MRRGAILYEMQLVAIRNTEEGETTGGCRDNLLIPLYYGEVVDNVGTEENAMFCSEKRFILPKLSCVGFHLED